MIQKVDDISAPWLHKPFNFIHIRQLAGSLLSYKDMLASAFENLVPGGWCETFEYECWIRDQRDDPTGAQIGTPMVGAPMLQQVSLSFRILFFADNISGKRECKKLESRLDDVLTAPGL